MAPWRVVFFTINFGLALLLVGICTVVLVMEWAGGSSPGAFFGGACFVLPAAAIGVGEWFLFVRQVRGLERPLGIACGLGGALVLFAFLANGAEAVAQGPMPDASFWLVFAPTCLALAGYGFWCCWLRVQHRTMPPARGFPVQIHSPEP